MQRLSISEPVSLDRLVSGLGDDLESSPEIGDLNGIFCCVQIPLRFRRIARVAPTVILVSLTIFCRPHPYCYGYSQHRWDPETLNQRSTRSDCAAAGSSRAAA